MPQSACFSRRMTQRTIPHDPRTAAKAAAGVRAEYAHTRLAGAATPSIAVLVLVVLISRLTGAG